MSMRFVLPAMLLCLSGAAFAEIPITQALTPVPIKKSPNLRFTQNHGLAFFNTNVGSFKLLGINEVPVEGTLDITFKGTVLISNLDKDSTLIISGDVRKEIDDKKLAKQVYFGRGRITICGKWRAVQFFGSDLRARFNGFGYCRLFGEFDKNLDTGYFWFNGDKQQTPWNTGGMSMVIPRADQVVPKVRIEGQ